MLNSQRTLNGHEGVATRMKDWNENINRLFGLKKFNYFAFAFIAAMIVLAYSNTFLSSFHFDDNPSIVENSSIKRLTWDNFVAMVKGGTRPVINLSLLFNYQLSGLNVIGWHIVNIGFHIANSIFLYLLLVQMLSLPSLQERYGNRAKKWPCLEPYYSVSIPFRQRRSPISSAAPS
jgi:hypothetical protein